MAMAKREIGALPSAASVICINNGPERGEVGAAGIDVANASAPPVAAGRGFAAPPVNVPRDGKSLRSLKSNCVAQNWRRGIEQLVAAVALGAGQRRGSDPAPRR